jgi:hypothetical protein
MYVRMLAAAEIFTNLRRSIFDLTSSLIKQENGFTLFKEGTRFSVSVIAQNFDQTRFLNDESPPSPMSYCKIIGSFDNRRFVL